MDIERYMTVKQAAAALGVQRGRIYQLIRERRLEVYRMGEHILIAKGEDGKPVVRKPERAA